MKWDVIVDVTKTPQYQKNIGKDDYLRARETVLRWEILAYNQLPHAQRMLRTVGTKEMLQEKMDELAWVRYYQRILRGGTMEVSLHTAHNGSRYGYLGHPGYGIVYPEEALLLWQASSERSGV